MPVTASLYVIDGGRRDIAVTDTRLDRRFAGSAISPSAMRPRGVAPVPTFDDLREDRQPIGWRAFTVSIVAHLIVGGVICALYPVGKPDHRHAMSRDMTVDLVTAASLPVPKRSPTFSPPHEAGRAPNGAGDIAPSVRHVAVADDIPVSTMPVADPSADTVLSPSVAPANSPTPVLPPEPADRSSLTIAPRSLAETKWEMSIVSSLERRKSYPAAARNAGLSDSILLRLIIGRNGHLLAAELARSHGIASLDRAALDMATRAGPFPAPPESITGDAIRLLVPVEFYASRNR